MSKTGPKQRTARNSRKVDAKSIWEGFTPPADFDAPALAEYDRLRDVLHTRGTLETTDPRMVIMAVRLYGLLRRAEDELAAAPTLTIRHMSARPMQHPMITTIANVSARLRGILNDLGLSPRALRASTKGATAQADPKGKTKWDGILNVAG